MRRRLARFAGAGRQEEEDLPFQGRSPGAVSVKSCPHRVLALA